MCFWYKDYQCCHLSSLVYYWAHRSKFAEHQMLFQLLSSCVICNECCKLGKWRSLNLGQLCIYPQLTRYLISLQIQYSFPTVLAVASIVPQYFWFVSAPLLLSACVKLQLFQILNLEGELKIWLCIDAAQHLPEQDSSIYLCSSTGGPDRQQEFSGSRTCSQCSRCISRAASSPVHLSAEEFSTVHLQFIPSLFLAGLLGALRPLTALGSFILPRQDLQQLLLSQIEKPQTVTLTPCVRLPCQMLIKLTLRVTATFFQWETSVFFLVWGRYVAACSCDPVCRVTATHTVLNESGWQRSTRWDCYRVE